jgi:hypothetical protein
LFLHHSANTFLSSRKALSNEYGAQPCGPAVYGQDYTLPDEDDRAKATTTGSVGRRRNHYNRIILPEACGRVEKDRERQGRDSYELEQQDVPYSDMPCRAATSMTATVAVLLSVYHGGEFLRSLIHISPTVIDCPAGSPAEYRDVSGSAGHDKHIGR